MAKQKSNRLFQEKSPYLKQHAYNPVDWYPWGDEAFEKAERENKPIFISIGYSTCHWCHVMERETFEDEETAAQLLAGFVCVKVDREEKPDIDAMYMTACQAMTGSGGWPLTVFTDWKKRPFFTGTYFHKESFQNILRQISEIWQTRPEVLKERAEEIILALKTEKKAGGRNKGFENLETAPREAFNYLMEHFDLKFGGFSNAPKFPTPHNLLFLLDYNKQTGEAESLSMCETTLRAMRQGGIYDHVGGGFSRYSTDGYWLVPHFEKMLYDNTLLMLAYLKCFETTQDAFYSGVVKGIADYLIRDMTHSGGGFYIAEDADSEGHEGLFYTFTMDEIRNTLKDSADEFCGYFNIIENGNFEGRNILNTIGRAIPKGREKFADECLKKLFNYRSGRIRPHRDQKIPVSYNGLAIAAFAAAGRILGDNSYIDIAINTAEFIEKNLTDGKGRLLSFYLDGPGKYSGFAEDYAFYIFGLLELYDAVKDRKYLTRAVELQDLFTEGFYDTDSGGFYISHKDAEQMPLRTKELYDGAVPSYNSAALHNLLALYKLTNEIKYMEQFIQTLKCFSDDISKYPQGYVHAVSAVMKLMAELSEIHVCVGSACRPPAQDLSEFIGYFAY